MQVLHVNETDMYVYEKAYFFHFRPIVWCGPARKASEAWAEVRQWYSKISGARDGKGNCGELKKWMGEGVF